MSELGAYTTRDDQLAIKSSSGQWRNISLPSAISKLIHYSSVNDSILWINQQDELLVSFVGIEEENGKAYSCRSYQEVKDGILSRATSHYSKAVHVNVLHRDQVLSFCIRYSQERNSLIKMTSLSATKLSLESVDQISRINSLLVGVDHRSAAVTVHSMVGDDRVSLLLPEGNSCRKLLGPYILANEGSIIMIQQSPSCDINLVRMEHQSTFTDITISTDNTLFALDQEKRLWRLIDGKFIQLPDLQGSRSTFPLLLWREKVQVINVWKSIQQIKPDLDPRIQFDPSVIYHQLPPTQLAYWTMESDREEVKIIALA